MNRTVKGTDEFPFSCPYGCFLLLRRFFNILSTLSPILASLMLFWDHISSDISEGN
jgi:hypothetical protein